MRVFILWVDDYDNNFEVGCRGVFSTPEKAQEMTLEQFLKLSGAERKAMPVRESGPLYAELMVRNLRAATTEDSPTPAKQSTLSRADKENSWIAERDVE